MHTLDLHHEDMNLSAAMILKRARAVISLNDYRTLAVPCLGHKIFDSITIMDRKDGHRRSHSLEVPKVSAAPSRSRRHSMSHEGSTPAVAPATPSEEVEEPVAGPSGQLQFVGAHYIPAEGQARLRSATMPSRSSGSEREAESPRKRSHSAPPHHVHAKHIPMDPTAQVEDDDNLMVSTEREWTNRRKFVKPGSEMNEVDNFGWTIPPGKALGEGGYGMVVMAVRKADGKECAMKIMNATKKVLPADIGKTSIRRQLTEVGKKFQIDTRHEIKVMKAVQHHPNFVTYLDHFVVNHYIYIVMELECMALDEQLLCCMSERKARQWFLQIANGIYFLHELGIVHRDIKPENILVRKFPDHTTCMRIADFGLSKFRTECDAKITGAEGVGCDRLKTVAGTPEYYAPEILRLSKNEALLKLTNDVFVASLMMKKPVMKLVSRCVNSARASPAERLLQKSNWK